jgi:segregation and condensation protein B
MTNQDLAPLKRILEGALLAVGQALSVDRLLELFDEDERPEKNDVLAALHSIQEDCAGKGYELTEVASGWRFQVCADLAPWINKMWEEKPQKYSRALLETLALIAYRQPLTRSDIEEVRGVAVSSHIIKTLAEREWIRVVGHRDVPGRPSLYATTRQFLDYFGLKSLDELPSLGELKDIDGLNANLNLGGSDSGEADEQDQIAQAQAISDEHADQNDALQEPATTTDQEQIEVARDEALREDLRDADDASPSPAYQEPEHDPVDETDPLK